MMLTKADLQTFLNKKIHITTQWGYHYRGKLLIISDSCIIMNDKFNESVTLALSSIASVCLDQGGKR